ncbi:MAG: 4Fe-4S binding protein [Prevotella sp.]|nr:4Fe-4S binding protein [Bacteroides sp.]MCM1366651.1 4Fe-4S binding protein [Prevotella sp.]MCM1437318.1 4Fe-4S binding protein [Prevotella sp.]
MKSLRILRVLISTLFFAATVGFFIIGLTEHPLVLATIHSQIIPSAISLTLGASIVWLVATLLFGRIYCSTICPVGTLQDLIIPLKKIMPGARKTYRYKTGGIIKYHILGIYIICLIIGFSIVPVILEPWNMMRTICATFRSDILQPEWLALGYGTGVGILAGIISLLFVFLAAIYFGRDFCNEICPLGTAMSLLDKGTLYHIEINPDKCNGCLKCEEECKASCIKVTERKVDNSRCVKCFDCINICNQDAITYRRGRHRPRTPIMQLSDKT